MATDIQVAQGYTVTSSILEANHLLHVSANDSSGKSTTVSLDLNSFIGNVNGALSLGGSDFMSNARNVKLDDDGETLDADLADVNGDYSTSSLDIAHTVGLVDGQVSLLMAIGLPHSTAHANADTVDAADQTILDKAHTTDGQSSISKAMTLQLNSDYDMNNPNQATMALLQQNFGPFGGRHSQPKRGSAADAAARVGFIIFGAF